MCWMTGAFLKTENSPGLEQLVTLGPGVPGSRLAEHEDPSVSSTST